MLCIIKVVRERMLCLLNDTLITQQTGSVVIAYKLYHLTPANVILKRVSQSNWLPMRLENSRRPLAGVTDEIFLEYS